MRAAVLINPHSRRGGDPAVQREVLGALSFEGIEPTLMASREKGDLARLAREAQGRFDVVVAAGGDGSINEVANGLVGGATPMGLMPLGTVNVDALALGIPMDIEGAARVIATGKPRKVSLGALNGRAFLFAAGVGFDAEVIRKEDLALKKVVGALAYYARGVVEVFRYGTPRLGVSLDGGSPILCASAIFGKARLYGGPFPMTPRASPFDPHVDALLLLTWGPAELARLMAGLLAGGTHVHEDFVLYRKVNSALCESSEGLSVQVDGELAGRTPARIETLPDALSILMP